ncbi:MAG: DedA family protein [Nitrososphaeraceae archaeon]
MIILNALIIFIAIVSAQQTEISNSSNHILKDIFNAVTDLIYDLGHFGIFVAALVETLFPIIPSELIFPLAGYVAQDQNLGIEYAITMALSGSLGSTLGAIVIYYISLKLGRRVLLRIGKYVLINERKLKRAEIWFEKHGQLAVFLGRLAPGIRELISIPAGLSKMNIIYFTFFTFIGSFIWSLSLTLVGFYLGDAWDTFAEESSDFFNIIAIAIIVVIGIILIIKTYKNKKRKKSSQ